MKRIKKKDPMRGSGVFVVIGVLLIVGAIFSVVLTYQFKQNAEPVMGIISYISEDNTVYVSYHAQGKEYTDIRLSEYNSSMSVGEKIELLYDTRNAREVKTVSMLYTLPVLLGIMGCGMVFVGGTILSNRMKKHKLKNRLLMEGYVIQAQVKEIRQNRNIRVNGRSPYLILGSFQDMTSGKEYIFVSENLWTEPSAVFTEGAYIDVYVDANDYSKYYVAAQEALDKKIVDFT